LTYAWSFVSKPAGSAAALSAPNVVNPTFTADKFGEYVLQLIVNDGFVNSAPDTVKITTRNSPPVANAGPDQSVFVTQTVTLDGSGSTDVDGDPLTFAWSLVSRPAGSAATLSDATAVKPTFVVDKPGTYVAQLIVNDGKENSPADTVSITTQNSAPVANAGPDQTVLLGSLVNLDGSASGDVDGNSLTYAWSFISRPPGSTAVLSAANVVNPTFTVDKTGEYVVQMIVNDGIVNSAPDSATITTVNSTPVAYAGLDQTVNVGDTVTLDGSASNDADGDLLTYAWALTVRPNGSGANLSNPNVVNPTFIADLAGTFVAQLVVNDGAVNSAPDTVVINAQQVKVAVPHVVGLTQSAAQSTLTAAGLVPAFTYSHSAVANPTYATGDGFLLKWLIRIEQHVKLGAELVLPAGLQVLKEPVAMLQQSIQAAIPMVLGDQSEIFAQQVPRCAPLIPLPMQAPFTARINESINHQGDEHVQPARPLATGG